jgi:hypothetical protein
VDIIPRERTQVRISVKDIATGRLVVRLPAERLIGMQPPPSGDRKLSVGLNKSVAYSRRNQSNKGLRSRNQSKQWPPVEESIKTMASGRGINQNNGLRSRNQSKQWPPVEESIAKIGHRGGGSWIALPLEGRHATDPHLYYYLPGP